MNHLRRAAAVAAAVSFPAAVLYVGAELLSWPFDRTALALLAGVGVMSAVVLWCSDVVVRRMYAVRDDILRGVAEETRHLHRSVAGIIDQYGDARAINAFLASEHQHQREVGESTTDLRATKAGNNVTRIRQRR